MKQKNTTALMNLVLLAIIVIFSACGGGGGGDDTPQPPPASDLWQGTWSLNTQETNWGDEFKNELPHYVGSYFVINGNSLRVVLVRDGLVETDVTGTFSVEGTTFTANIEGETLVGAYDLQNDNTKAVIYWSEAAGGDTEVYDKAPPVPMYAFGSSFLQYRVYEGVSPRYSVWLPMTKNGIPIQEADIDSVSVFNSSDNAVTPANEGFYSEVTMSLNCLGGPCVESGPMVEHAWLGNFLTIPELPADTYSFEVDTADGQTLDLDIPYLGQLELPIITTGVMQSAWSGGNLVLTWMNPTGAANWLEVDQLRIRLFDSSGMVVLAVRLNSTADTVTIPGSLLAQAADLGDGTLQTWEVQTRALDANNMNFARGYSLRLGLSAP